MDGLREWAWGRALSGTGLSRGWEKWYLAIDITPVIFEKDEINLYDHFSI